MKDKSYTDKLNNNFLLDSFLLCLLPNWNFHSVFLVKSKLSREGMDYNIRLFIGSRSFPFVSTVLLSLVNTVEPRGSIFHLNNNKTKPTLLTLFLIINLKQVPNVILLHLKKHFCLRHLNKIVVVSIDNNRNKPWIIREKNRV